MAIQYKRWIKEMSSYTLCRSNSQELTSEVRHNSHGDLNTEFSFRILRVCHYIINSYVDHHQK